MTNNLNVVITEADKTIIANALATINTVLNPYLIALTDDERKGGQKMGDKSVAFVQKALQYGNQFSAILPNYIDLNAFKTDVEAVTILTNYVQQISTLLRSAEDTVMVSGVEAFEAANAVYSALKMAAGNNVPGVQDAVNDLKQRYPGKVRANKANPIA